MTVLEVIERAAVGVQGELAGGDALVVDGIGDELFGEAGGLAGGDEPGDDVAGVDVEDHVEVEPGPLVGAAELGDVPGPHLVGAGGDQLGLDVRGAAGLALVVRGPGGAARRSRYMVEIDAR